MFVEVSVEAQQQNPPQQNPPQQNPPQQKREAAGAERFQNTPPSRSRCSDASPSDPHSTAPPLTVGSVLGQEQPDRPVMDGTRIRWTLKTHLRAALTTKVTPWIGRVGLQGPVPGGWEVGGPWVLQQV
uniref:Uncharacterized protein n=1 Tax=Knipowitschia caucasica TaxID=637954 RepID=A0AAV2J6I5_KNICA